MAKWFDEYDENSCLIDLCKHYNKLYCIWCSKTYSGRRLDSFNFFKTHMISFHPGEFREFQRLSKLWYIWKRWAIISKQQYSTHLDYTERKQLIKPKPQIPHLKPWKDPESLFCDTKFLEELIGRKIKK